MTSTDRFEKQIVLESPRSRVWRAITDVKQFNEWFGVELTSPLTAGAPSSGNITNKGYEHLVMTIWVEKVQPEHYFSFQWHPDAKDPGADYSKEPTTLIEFTLEDVQGGTKLTIAESGFDALPESRRTAAFSGNARGWEQQLQRIGTFLASHP